MRGKPNRLFRAVNFARNIPAYAGKTTPIPTIKRDLEEHPRVCGENDKWRTIKFTTGGTSPRMRGKLYDFFVQHF